MRKMSVVVGVWGVEYGVLTSVEEREGGGTRMFGKTIGNNVLCLLKITYVYINVCAYTYMYFNLSYTTWGSCPKL